MIVIELIKEQIKKVHTARQANPAFAAGLIVFLVTVTAFFTIVVMAICFFSVNVETTGAFGDTFGVLTSMFSGFAALAAFVLITLQKDEMKQLREQLAEKEKEPLTSIMLTSWIDATRRLQEAGPNQTKDHFKKIILPELYRIKGAKNLINDGVLVEIVGNDFDHSESLKRAIRNYTINSEIAEFFNLKAEFRQPVGKHGKGSVTTG